MPQAMVEFIEVRGSFATMVGMATSPSKPCFGRFLFIRPSSWNTYRDCRISMASPGISRAIGQRKVEGDVGSSDKAS